MSILTDILDVFTPSQRDPAPRQKASISRPVVKRIVADALAPLCEEIDRDNAKRDRKLVKATEQAKAAAKEAAEAKEAVERLVETARETFRDVIAELLEPHYRLLAQHLGIELPIAAAKPKAVEKKLPVSERNTPKPDSAGSPRSKEPGKMRRGTSVKAPKKKTTTKATATVRRTKTKGARPCRKK